MKQFLDSLYDAIFDAYTSETNAERKAMYDDTLTILANLDYLIPGFTE